MKYLGVNLDKHLSFEMQTDKIVTKVNQRTGLLWKLKSFINEALAKYLYLTGIHPLFLYCDSVYDGCTTAIAIVSYK